MIKLLIYDLDGTLIDSCKDIANGVNWALKGLGFRALSEKQISSFVGKGVRNLMQMVLQESSQRKEKPDEKLLERAIKLYRNHYQHHLLDKTKLFPSVREVLEHFKGRKQAVITNKPEDFSRQILNGLGIASYFFCVIGGDRTFPKKPSPEPVLEIMKLARALPSETVLVGDSDIDVQTGKNAGIKTIAVTYGFGSHQEIRHSNPDLILDDLQELIGCTDLL